jgi:hypothetical protein
MIVDHKVEINLVPKNDGSHHQVEAAGPVNEHD